jgi:UDP-N-acetylglucosamine--N-acetylmuramyl-(pentapeptide) pyrophosphoryl-undecaprenol N-acetylglucosamine transferase
MKRIVLVGGGSGGHFYPLIAVAEALGRASDAELFYMGPDEYDREALSKNRITFIYCPAGKQRKYRSIKNFFDGFKILYGFFVAVYKLYVLYPDVVFSKGGYTSVPVTLASFILRIPVVIHESDTKPGSANKLAAKFARYIAISFDETTSFFTGKNVALTGIPLREEFTQSIGDPYAVLGIPITKPLLFITGGSQGAQRLNDLALESLDELLPAFTVLHQAGDLNAKNVEASAATLITDSSLLESYFVKGSLTGTEMNAAMSASALIISRAGTGTIFEIAYKGKPSIVVPIPEAISHDQRTNAYSYARSGACSVLEEHNFTDGLLASEITRIIGDQTLYESMQTAALGFRREDAGKVIATTLIGISQEHGS